MPVPLQALRIALGGDARIKPTDTLTLADTQTALFDFFNPTLYFTGKHVPVPYNMLPVPCFACCLALH